LYLHCCQHFFFEHLFNLYFHADILILFWLGLMCGCHGNHVGPTFMFCRPDEGDGLEEYYGITQPGDSYHSPSFTDRGRPRERWGGAYQG